MRITVSMEGTDRVVGRIDRMHRSARDGAPRAMFRQAELTRTKAVRRTPLETGALRASSFVRVADRNAVEIVFGGPGAPYAIYVHENLNARHPVGQAKFLESAVQEDAAAFAEAIAKDMIR